jgi:hypothetical protein
MKRAGAIDAPLLRHAELLERLNLPTPNRPVAGNAENMICAAEQHCGVRNPSDFEESALWTESSGRGDEGGVRPMLCRVLEVWFGFCR